MAAPNTHSSAPNKVWQLLLDSLITRHVSVNLSTDHSRLITHSLSPSPSPSSLTASNTASTLSARDRVSPAQAGADEGQQHRLLR